MSKLVRPLLIFAALFAWGGAAAAQDYTWVAVVGPSGKVVPELRLRRPDTNHVSEPTADDTGMTRLPVSQGEKYIRVELHQPPEGLQLVLPRRGLAPVAPKTAPVEMLVCRKGECRQFMNDRRAALAIVSEVLAAMLPRFAGIVNEGGWEERLRAAAAATGERLGIPPNELESAARNLAGDQQSEFWQGVRALHAQQFNKAARLLSGLTQSQGDPAQAADAALFVGQAFFELGMYADAVAFLQLAESLARDDSEIANARAVALHKAGRYAAAVEVFRALAARDPKNGFFNFNLANALMMSGDAAGASKTFELSARLDSRFASVALIGAGDAYATAREYPQAVAFYRRALEEGKSNDFADFNIAALRRIGWVYEETRNPELGLTFYEEVLKHARVTQNQGAQASALASTAGIYEQQGKNPEALTAYHLALVSAERAFGVDDPRLVAFLVSYSRALARAGRNQEARALELRSQQIMSGAK